MVYSWVSFKFSDNISFRSQSILLFLRRNILFVIRSELKRQLDVTKIYEDLECELHVSNY